MNNIKKLTLPLNNEQIKDLRAGDIVELTGVIYTGRDAAHKRLVELLDNNKPLPIDVKGGAIYYVGPTPAKPGRAIGSAGPTSSYRMDAYSEPLLKEGLKLMLTHVILLVFLLQLIFNVMLHAINLLSFKRYYYE